MTKIGVVLSGCGVMDGSEIHESVLTLLALARHKAEAVCMAPDKDQAHVVNHLTNEPAKEKRNVLVESARIARGNILNVKDVRAADVDGLVFPGGFGAAKNLCTFAFDGAECSADAEVARLTREVHAAGKPIGAICIAPVLVAKIFQGGKMRLTIGNDAETAGAIRAMGHEHADCAVGNAVVDEKNRIVTTPAYMLARDLAEAFEGIEKLVENVVRLAAQPAGNPA